MVSDEEKERRRARALKMHSEVHPDDPQRRRFGGRQPNSGAPRKMRATERAAERISREGDLIADAIIDALRNGTHGIRLSAVKLAMDIEHREAELQLKEDRQFEEIETQQLLESLVDDLAVLRETGMLQLESGPVLEADVVGD